MSRSDPKREINEVLPTEPENMQDRHYAHASYWQLIWWKFRQHKLAMVAAVVLGLMYFIAIFAGFVSPTTPLKRFENYRDAPPQKIHFVDEEGRFHFRPFVYDLERKLNTETFRRYFVEDTSMRYPIYLFVRGEPYRFWGLFNTDIHLLGVAGRGNPFFLLGTDRLGRDLFSRIVLGTRISLSFGFVGIIFTFVLGLIMGGVSGYLGGVVDAIIQRIIELLLAIPKIPLWMALAAALPRDWPPLKIYLGMVLILSMIGWTGLARVVRGKLLSLREEDFVMSARLSGANHWRIISRHLLPSFLSYIIVSVTLAIPQTILGETALSFLGIGLQPPVVSWGVLLQDAQKLQSIAHHPWLLWPGAFVMVAVLMYNFLGDGLRDAADPYK